ncbi:hypothetical protein [Mesorhizobium sp. L2C067A000]|uniref:hypothetical protein n=1 Tax=Mesorhizobium sp. L2C067A000 TaxID=1287106 RepID=UPI0003D01986|nr:hypothetical protein [Mesorhizobium sp. L2C067A000]ESZ33839.1 hypothetical protein X733_13600 [Mesorhizobium sp. L2C067A000]
MTKTATINGSWGSLTVDASTGNVLSYDDGGTLPDPDCPPERGYTDYVRVDLDEWRKTYTGQEPDCLDVLDVGFWYLDDGVEKYEGPEQDWRDEYERGGNR